jgi:hypothetical protein
MSPRCRVALVIALLTALAVVGSLTYIATHRVAMPAGVEQ